MPAPAKRPCRKRGCAGLTIERHGYCADHAELGSGWNNPRRGTAASRGYDHNWKKLREQILVSDKRLCRPCKEKDFIKLATQVDHIIPKAEGGTDHPSNLQSICDGCHSEKTKKESKKAQYG